MFFPRTAPGKNDRNWSQFAKVVAGNFVSRFMASCGDKL